MKAAWLSVKADIRASAYFTQTAEHEFANEDIKCILIVGNIDRSLNRSRTPIDNAVCESMYDIVKTEFVFEETFINLQDLQNKLAA